MNDVTSFAGTGSQIQVSYVMIIMLSMETDAR